MVQESDIARGRYALPPIFFCVGRRGAGSPFFIYMGGACVVCPEETLPLWASLRGGRVAWSPPKIVFFEGRFLAFFQCLLCHFFEPSVFATVPPVFDREIVWTHRGTTPKPRVGAGTPNWANARISHLPKWAPSPPPAGNVGRPGVSVRFGRIWMGGPYNTLQKDYCTIIAS